MGEILLKKNLLGLVQDRKEKSARICWTISLSAIIKKNSLQFGNFFSEIKIHKNAPLLFDQTTFKYPIEGKERGTTRERRRGGGATIECANGVRLIGTPWSRK